MEENKLVITENGKKDLLVTATWSRFYAIISLISVVFIFVAGIVMLVSSFFIDGQQSGLDVSMLAPAGVLYIVLGGILIIPTMNLLQFAQKTKQSVAENNTELMECAINRMKSYWKFMGIFTIIALTIIPLMIILSAFLMV